jgi:hypothetical protein
MTQRQQKLQARIRDLNTRMYMEAAGANDPRYISDLSESIRQCEEELATEEFKSEYYQMVKT